MSGKVECVSLGLATVEFLPEIQISHSIACKNDEKITTIHPCKLYDDVFRERDDVSER